MLRLKVSFDSITRAVRQHFHLLDVKTLQVR